MTDSMSPKRISLKGVYICLFVYLLVSFFVCYLRFRGSGEF